MTMTFMTRLAFASLALAASLTPAFAAGPSPVGSWVSTDGQAQVRVTMCGDGTALCAKLTALRGTARTSQNLHLLNSYVVEQAAMADANSWQGTVHFNGQTATGHITLVGTSTISVSGCQLGMCKTFQFTRVSERVAAAMVAASAAAPAETVAQARTVGLTVSE
jgi:Uncharacterized protein conserved in bacteria (DUF2147)